MTTAHPDRLRRDRGPLFFDAAPDYKNFHLRVEARVADKGSGGVHFRARRITRSPRVTRRLHQQQQRPENPLKTGTLSAHGLGMFKSLAKVPNTPIAAGEWFTMEVIADGNSPHRARQWRQNRGRERSRKHLPDRPRDAAAKRERDDRVPQGRDQGVGARARAARGRGRRFCAALQRQGPGRMEATCRPESRRLARRERHPHRSGRRQGSKAC